MRKLSVGFTAILFVAFIINGIHSSENPTALRQLNPLSSLINSILDPVLKAIRSIANAIAGVLNNLQDLIFRELPNIINGLIQTISQTIQNTTSEAVRNILDAILILVEEEVANIVKLIENLQERQNALQKILANIENEILDVIDGLRIYLEKCLGKVPLQVIQILRRLTADATKCSAGITEVISAELQRVNGIVVKVNNLVDVILGNIAECLENDEQAAIDCLQGVQNGIGDSLKEIEDALKSNSTVNEAVIAVQQCVQAIVNVANSTLTC